VLPSACHFENLIGHLARRAISVDHDDARDPPHPLSLGGGVPARAHDDPLEGFLGRQLGELAHAFPYLAEVVAGHVAKVGYDFASSFEYGLDLILEGLERRRDAA
jgi:hypothetical protein